jgi:hypothetical protein
MLKVMLIKVLSFDAEFSLQWPKKLRQEWHCVYKAKLLCVQSKTTVCTKQNYYVYKVKLLCLSSKKGVSILSKTTVSAKQNTVSE